MALSAAGGCRGVREDDHTHLLWLRPRPVLLPLLLHLGGQNLLCIVYRRKIPGPTNVDWGRVEAGQNRS